MRSPASAATPPAAHSLQADYFDGRSARAQPVILRWNGPTLQIRGAGIALDVAARRVRWPERTRHGQRVAQLNDGGTLQARDAEAWDDWLRAGGQRESLVVSAQQSWHWTLGGVTALALLLAAMAVWGIPRLGRAALLAIPPSIDKGIGETTLAALDRDILQPSSLDAAQQDRKSVV